MVNLQVSKNTVKLNWANRKGLRNQVNDNKKETVNNGNNWAELNKRKCEPIWKKKKQKKNIIV